MIGQRIGTIRIEAEIGRGGMGVVYRGIDEQLDRPVALKFMRRDLVAKEQDRQRFLREAKVMASIDHPNVGTVYQAGVDDEGALYLCMAYYSGESLRTRLARERLLLSEAIDLAIQMVRGLARAHTAGVVHRDIKPGNVLLTDWNEAKIVDFGLAKMDIDSVTLTQSGATLGTVAYMSPEQAYGDEVDARSDIWSVGVVLYEMLEGRRPFEGKSLASLMNSVLNRDPQPIEITPIELCGPAQEVVSRALEKDPKDRYQTAEEMLQDLEDLQQAADSQNRMETVSFGTSRAKKKTRLPIRATWAIGLFLAIFLSSWWLTHQTSTRSVSSPELEQILVRGESLLLSGDSPAFFREAESLFRAAVNQYPDSMEAQVGLAGSLLEAYRLESNRANLEEAQQLIENANRMWPDSPRVLASKGRWLQLVGRDEEAVEILRHLHALHGDRFQIRRFLVRSLAATGEVDEAENYARQSAREADGDWSRWQDLGRFLLNHTSDVEDAEKAFRKADELAEGTSEFPISNLGSLLLQLGRFDEALEVLERLEEPIVKPQDASNLGTAHYFLGNLDQAIHYYELAVRLHPSDVMYRGNLGDALLEKGRTVEAQEAYRMAASFIGEKLAENPERPNFLLRHAFYSSKAGECEPALDLHENEAAVSRFPSGSHYDLAQSLSYCNENQKAIEHLEKAIGSGLRVSSEILKDDFPGLAENGRFQRVLNEL